MPVGLRSLELMFPSTQQVSFLTEEDQNDMFLVKRWMQPKQVVEEPTDEIKAALNRTTDLESVLTTHYENLVRAHFVQFASPRLVQCVQKEAALEELCELITQLESVYYFPFRFHTFSPPAVDSFSRTFQALVRISVPQNHLSRQVIKFMTDLSVRRASEIVRVLALIKRSGLLYDAAPCLASAVKAEMETDITRMFGRKWKTTCLPDLYKIIENEYAPAMVELQEFVDLVREDTNGRQLSIVQSLLVASESVFFQVRVSQLFDTILEYPSSLPGLQDLKTCMKQSVQRSSVVSTLQRACSTRLLHSGVDTSEIVCGYISIIKALTVLEPRGVLLDKVAFPVRRYLRERQDTVDVLVDGLLREDSSDVKVLAFELEALYKHKAKESRQATDTAGVAIVDLDWRPNPNDAPLDFLKSRPSDVVSSFLSLYDNKEVFVKRFAMSYAARLLGSPMRGLQVADLQLVLELLKLFFGDELHSLEVMMKDISDSARINQDISFNDGMVQFGANVLSRLYWPPLQASEMKLPEPIEQLYAAYAQEFSKHRKDRKLNWLKSLGTVRLTLDLEDRAVEFVVRPDQAATIMVFQDCEAVSCEHVANTLGVPQSQAQEWVAFWVDQGILYADSEEPSKFRVLERKVAQTPDSRVYPARTVCPTTDTGIMSIEDRRTHEMQMYSSYIKGMLTNLGPMPVDRIHSFLRMVVPRESPYTKTVDELVLFLDTQVEQGLLDRVDAKYKLVSCHGSVVQ